MTEPLMRKEQGDLLTKHLAGIAEAGSFSAVIALVYGGPKEVSMGFVGRNAALGERMTSLVSDLIPPFLHLMGKEMSADVIGSLNEHGAGAILSVPGPDDTVRIPAALLVVCCERPERETELERAAQEYFAANIEPGIVTARR